MNPINLNSNTSNSFINISTDTTQQSATAKSNNGRDSFVASSEIKQDKTTNKKKNILAYLTAGIAAILGGIYTINRLRRGKTPSNKVLGKMESTGETIIHNNYFKQIDNMINDIQEKFDGKLDYLNKLDYIVHIEYLKPEAKRFMIDEGIQIFVEKAANLAEKINCKDGDDLFQIFKALNKSNKEVFKAIIENAESLKIDDKFSVIRALIQIDPKHKDFTFNTLLPIISKEPDKFMIQSSKDILEYLKNIRPDNKEFALKTLLPELLKEPDRFMIQSAQDVGEYIINIRPDNKEFAFNEVMPLLVANKEPLKIFDGSKMAVILGHITPETKDAVEVVAKNADKFGIDYVEDFILAITPENKHCIELIANNSKKLGIKDFSNVAEHKELLDRGIDGIKKLLGT